MSDFFLFVFLFVFFLFVWRKNVVLLKYFDFYVSGECTNFTLSDVIIDITVY